MARLPQSALALVESGAHGHLATVNADGSPQLSVVWVGVEDDELCVAALTERLKLRNVRRDPRVAVTFESPESDVAGERGAGGLRYFLGVKGTARVTEGGAPELLQQLARRYLGPDVRFPPMPDPPPGFVVRIEPQRLGGIGPWA